MSQPLSDVHVVQNLKLVLQKRICALKFVQSVILSSQADRNSLIPAAESIILKKDTEFSFFFFLVFLGADFSLFSAFAPSNHIYGKFYEQRKKDKEKGTAHVHRRTGGFRGRDDARQNFLRDCRARSRGQYPGGEKAPFDLQTYAPRLQDPAGARRRQLRILARDGFEDLDAQRGSVRRHRRTLEIRDLVPR